MISPSAVPTWTMMISVKRCPMDAVKMAKHRHPDRVKPAVQRIVDAIVLDRFFRNVIQSDETVFARQRSLESSVIAVSQDFGACTRLMKAILVVFVSDFSII